MRELIAILLFVVGMVLGAAASAFYYAGVSASLQATLVERQNELDRMSTSSAAERESLKQELASANEALETFKRDLELSQQQLSEQALLIARQKELLAAHGDQLVRNVEESETAEESSSAAVGLPPSERADGAVKGGQFVYRKVRWAQRDEDFEVAGELENRTKKQFANAIFHIELFGKGNQLLDTVVVTINNFSPGKVIPFNMLALQGRPELYGAVLRFKVNAVLLQE